MTSRRKNILYKSFSYYKWLMFGFVAVAFFTTFIFSVVSILMESNRENELEAARNTYGKYYYCVPELNEEEKNLLLAEEWIDKVYIVEEKDFWILLENTTNKQQVRYLYADDEIWDITNYALTEGRSPANSDEVVVPESYMISLGFSQGDMVGQTIQLFDYTNDCDMPKTVCGITRKNVENITDSYNNRPYFIFHKEDELPPGRKYSVYITIDSSVMSAEFGYDHFYNRDNTWAADKEKYASEPNVTLLTALGYTDYGEKELKKNQGISLVISLVCIFFGAILVGNIVGLAMNKWKYQLETLNMLGASQRKVNAVVNRIIIFRIILGEIIGLAIAFGAISFFGRHYFSTVKVPYGLVAGALFLEFKASVIAIFIYKSNKQGNESTKAYVSIFSFRIGRYFRYALRNFSFYNRKKRYNILVIAISLLVVFTLMIQYDQSEKELDNNDEYDYFIQIEDYFNVKALMGTTVNDELALAEETSFKIRDYCKEQGITQYYAGYATKYYNLSQDNMSSEMKNSLRKTASGASALFRPDVRLQIKASIMGCSPEAFDELGVRRPSNENEAIVLSRLTNRRDYYNKTLNSMQGEKFTFGTLMMGVDGFLNLDLNVADVTDKLLVCPLTDDNQMIILVDIDTYNYYFNMDFPSSFYIRDLTEKQYEEIRLLADNSYWIQIINQKEMKEEVLKAERTKHLIVALVLILCCVYCFVNIQTQQSLENRLREGENELLTSLGVPRKTVIATRSLENAMVFILGGLLGLILIFVLYEVMFDFGIVNGQMNVWSFVLESLVVITAFTCASFIMDFTRQWKVNARSGQ